MLEVVAFVEDEAKVALVALVALLAKVALVAELAKVALVADVAKVALVAEAALPVVFWFSVGNVQFARFPEDGVPNAGVVKIGEVVNATVVPEPEVE